MEDGREGVRGGGHFYQWGQKVGSGQDERISPNDVYL